MFRLLAAAVGLYLLTLAAALPRAQSTDGLTIFRYDTFGDEQLWTDVLRMQHALTQVSPATALSVGLKVDADALPQTVIDLIKTKQVNLNDPAVTIQLLKLNAVVGVIGKVVGANDNLATVGITCALCHSTVDNSVDLGIGRRLDGWANTTLNVGAIIALSPAIRDKRPFQSWGPGKFDPRFHIFDGKNLIQINDTTIPVVIPPIYGLQNVLFETFTADGPISYWNNYVGVTQMGGQGSFHDDRIGVHVKQNPDLVTPKLPALLQYQLSLRTPLPPAGSFDPAAASRGADVFAGAGRCASCHKPPTLTDVVDPANPAVPFTHDPVKIPTNRDYAERSATMEWRTTPLRGLWQHAPYFHDGSARDLPAVVDRYDQFFPLGLTPEEKSDLVQFLKSI